MRSFVLVPFLFGSACLAQDAAQMANQQMQIQQQMQQQQQIQQQVDAQNQQLANQIAQANLSSYAYGALVPTLKQEPGAHPGEVQVRLKDRTRGALIFYTVDGWTPTPSSTRYTGPIVLTHDTMLRAVAIAPGALRSRVLTAAVSVPAAAAGTGTTSPTLELADLAPGTAIPLLFTADLSSHGIEVGDRAPVALACDVLVDGRVVAPRLTAVQATVTEVDAKGRAGAPGSITFQVHSFGLEDGRTVTLNGTETLEGEPRTGRAAAVGFIPFAGFGALLIHGEEAVIPKGAELTAHVAGDGTLTAASIVTSH